VLALLTLGVCVTLAVAATSIINLGKPTNTQSTNAYFPLGGFRHGAPVLQAAGKPELLWTGTAWPGDSASSAERWPLVKALAQFGSFDTMNVAKQVCISSTYNLGGQITVHPCTIPTFDWSRATYRSPYLSFVHKDLIDARGHLFQRLSGDEAGLFDRYVRRKAGNQVKQIAASIYDPDAAPSDVSRSFPLLLIGGYRQTLTGEPSIGGFGSQRWSDTDPKVTHGLPYIMYEQTLSFQQARAALATGRTPHLAAITGQPPPDFSSLIPDVNAEANIITALICHADGKRPAKICGRSVIRQILKHVK
jgi:hypothetical protein